MMPNEADALLEEIRTTYEAMAGTFTLSDEARQLADLVKQLDDHLSAGGELPDDWCDDE